MTIVAFMENYVVFSENEVLSIESFNRMTFGVEKIGLLARLYILLSSFYLI